MADKKLTKKKIEEVTRTAKLYTPKRLKKAMAAASKAKRVSETPSNED